MATPTRRVEPGSSEAMRLQFERQTASASESNLMMGSMASSIAVLIGAGIWAAVTVLTHFQIGWMAVGVGFVSGYAMRMFGKGTTPMFGIVSAALSLIGCMIGNYFAVCAEYAAFEQISFGDVLSATSIDQLIGLMTLSFHPMDLLFYGLAIWFGYKYAFEPEAQPEAADKAEVR